MKRTPREQAGLVRIGQRIKRLQDFLSTTPRPSPGADALEWHRYLAAMKAIVGNASNDGSLVACLMAKDYLCRQLPMRPFDVALKAQGAKGLDIDERTLDGERVIGEIKTTVPHLGHDLGGAQKSAFAKDFKKLLSTRATHKFFFITDPATFVVLHDRYAKTLPGVRIVLLTTGEEMELTVPADHDRLDEGPVLGRVGATGVVPEERLDRKTTGGDDRALAGAPASASLRIVSPKRAAIIRPSLRKRRSRRPSRELAVVVAIHEAKD